MVAGKWKAGMSTLPRPRSLPLSVPVGGRGRYYRRRGSQYSMSNGQRSSVGASPGTHGVLRVLGAGEGLDETIVRVGPREL